MSEQFKDQGGAATMDPSIVRRWLTSKFMTAVSSESRQLKLRNKAEQLRIKNGAPHLVEYFHQLEDGYSHLAAQVLHRFSERYDISLHCHLVGGPAGDNSPEPELLLKLSCYDSYNVAPYYGLWFPEHDGAISPEFLQTAQRLLAQLLLQGSGDEFSAKAADVGKAMWSGDITTLRNLSQEFGSASETSTKELIAKGNDRRAELKHYSGAMFYYAGEWYWGVDRLYHLEQRLIELGLDRTPGEPLIAPRQAVTPGPLKDEGKLTLEFYPSLRSPYTAIAFDQTVDLAKQTGVTLKMLPVLPMVMRGVPATREKGTYILFDTGREARAAGVPFGPCYDPIGEPARRGYSLLQWAAEQGKEVELFSAFLRCAWVEAINTNNDRGMRKVLEAAGLNWSQAKQVIGNPDWQAGLEANRLAMYDAGLWGVPSYRLLDQNGHELLALWGQDRLWIIAARIQEALQGIRKS